jgi:endoglucanase
MVADRLIVGAAALVVLAGPAAAACPAAPLPSVASTIGAVAALEAAFGDYKRRHIMPDGRVVDSANGGISHSEGQGYAMLLAAKVGDRDTFERVWRWTTANLAVRDDHLFAWRWSPDETPPVGDTNNATDGDILIVWALVEAARLWDEPRYAEAARAIAADIGRLAITTAAAGPLLLPAAEGFGAGDRADGPVINLSYYVFPAEAALREAAPDLPWSAVFGLGRHLLDGRSETLPTDWSRLGPDGAEPADGFPPVFGYNAIRIPLYVAWAGCDPALLSRFAALWPAPEAPPAVIDVTDGRAVEPLAEPGYGAIPALVACALAPEGAGRAVASGPADQNYYPATIGLLAQVAQLELYPWCSA